MFRTHETRLGPGALSTPGTAVPATARCNPWPPHAASQRPVPVTPVQRSVPGSPNNGASARVHQRSPLPAFPSPVIPGTVRGTLGFSLSSAPGRARPSRARQGGNEPQALPGVTSSASAGLLRRTHSTRATSCRTIIRFWTLNIPATACRSRRTGSVAPGTKWVGGGITRPAGRCSRSERARTCRRYSRRECCRAALCIGRLRCRPWPGWCCRRSADNRLPGRGLAAG
jgi:hypothetical protein